MYAYSYIHVYNIGLSENKLPPVPMAARIWRFKHFQAHPKPYYKYADLTPYWIIPSGND